MIKKREENPWTVEVCYGGSSQHKKDFTNEDDAEKYFENFKRIFQSTSMKSVNYRTRFIEQLFTIENELDD